MVSDELRLNLFPNTALEQIAVPRQLHIGSSIQRRLIRLMEKTFLFTRPEQILFLLPFLPIEPRIFFLVRPRIIFHKLPISTRIEHNLRARRLVVDDSRQSCRHRRCRTRQNILATKN